MQPLPRRLFKKECGLQMELHKLQRRGKKTVYCGESSMTLFERMVEHQKKMEKHDVESPLVEHHQDMHPGVPIRMKLELVKA